MLIYLATVVIVCATANMALVMVRRLWHQRVQRIHRRVESAVACEMGVFLQVILQRIHEGYTKNEDGADNGNNPRLLHNSFSSGPDSAMINTPLWLGTLRSGVRWYLRLQEIRPGSLSPSAPDDPY